MSSDILRRAVTALRCDHYYPTAPDSTEATGPCTACGTPYARPRVPDAVREPLADLLDALGDIAAYNEQRGLRAGAVQVPRGVALARVLLGEEDR